jgi:two-component system sensor histidine kinase YesM
MPVGRFADAPTDRKRDARQRQRALPRAIRLAFGNLKLFPKYLLSHGVVAVLTALVVSSVSFSIAKDQMEVYARASANTILTQTGIILEKKNSDLQKNLVAQLDQAGIYRLLRQGTQFNDIMSRLRLERQLAVMMSTNRWMRSILLLPKSAPALFCSADDSVADREAIRAFDPAAIEQLHGGAYWYVDHEGSVFFCKTIYDLETTENLGILAIGIDSDFFEGLSPNDRYRGLGALFIVSADSRQLIFHTSTTPEVLERAEAWAAGRETPPLKFRLRGRAYLSSTQFTDSRNWQIMSIISVSELTSLSSRTGALILYTTLMILAIALTLAFFLVRSEVGKIKTLVAQTHLIANGNFELAVGFRSHDELGELAAEIRSMALKIGELVERVASEKNQKTEAELKALNFEYSALQSNINPHFIANTLEFVNSAAKIHGVPEVGEIACLLGDLMRESIRRKENLITLEEELDHCRSYLRIQELLHESKLEVIYEVPIDQMDCLVPNLILQPLIENAILHGIEPKIGDATITISSRSIGSSLVLTVADDGIGIAPERLPELLVPRSTDPMRKIGIESVDKRIKILFGPSYGLSITSRPGAGTEVDLRIPRTNRFAV